MSFEETKKRIAGTIDEHVCSNSDRINDSAKAIVNNNYFFSRESEERMVLAMCQRMEKNN